MTTAVGIGPSKFEYPQQTLTDWSITPPQRARSCFTRSLSGPLAEKGIRVNAVAPGPICTPLIPSSFQPDKVASFGTKLPLGGVEQPNEVAPSFLFLACDDSSYFAGQVLHPNSRRPAAAVHKAGAAFAPS